MATSVIQNPRDTSASSVAAAAAAASVTTTRPISSLKELMFSREAHLFLRARNNIMEILEKRGFDVSPYMAESPEEVEKLMENPLQFTYHVTEDNSEIDDDKKRRCKVVFAKTIANAIDIIKDFHMGEGHPERLIAGRDEVLIIIFGTLSETGIKTTIANSRATGLQMDAVHIQHLQFNPLKHELVPEYEIIPLGSPYETEIMDSVAIKKKKQFPLIRSDDIISRLLGLRPEQMMIVRNKGPIGKHTFIRVCSDN